MSNHKTFEEKMSRLEQIVNALERGEVPLEESLKLFQEGTQLAQECGTILDNAQLQVTKLSFTDDGTPREEVFADEQ